MRLSCAPILVLFALLFCTTAGAQQSPQRDPQALAVLTQMVAATGWSSSNVPVDAVANGSVTVERPTGSEVRNIVIKARRGRQLKVESPSGATSIVVNGEQGRRSTPTATEYLQPHATYSVIPANFPFFTILAESFAPEVSLTYRGTETVRGEIAHRIEFQRKYQIGDGLDSARNRASRMVVSVSTTSYLPLKVEYDALSDKNPTSFVPVTCHLSDYRRVGVLVLPFRLEEFAGDRRLYTLQVDTAQLNVGLTDSEFTVR